MTLRGPARRLTVVVGENDTRQRRDVEVVRYVGRGAAGSEDGAS